MSLLDDLPFDFKGGEARIFRQNKLKDHDSIYDYLDINSFSNPVFQDMNVAEITNFLRDIISGDDLLAYLRKFECHARRAERNVKLMSKTWKAKRLITLRVSREYARLIMSSTLPRKFIKKELF